MVTFIGHDVLTAVVIKNSFVCDITPCFALAYYLAYYSALKMEMTWSSETSDAFERTARCYILDNINRQYGGQEKCFFRFRCDGDK
jgi:hypothetical protein